MDDEAVTEAEIPFMVTVFKDGVGLKFVPPITIDDPATPELVKLVMLRVPLEEDDAVVTVKSDDETAD